MDKNKPKSLPKEYYQELIAVPFNAFLASFSILKKFIQTTALTIFNPPKLLLNADDTILSALKSCKVVLNLIFITLTIFAFFKMTKETEPTILLFKEYLAYLIYISSLFLLMMFSFVWNVIEQKILKNSDLIINALVYYFNMIYIGLLAFNLLKIDLNSNIIGLIISIFILTFYYLLRLKSTLGLNYFKVVLIGILLSVSQIGCNLNPMVACPIAQKSKQWGKPPLERSNNQI